MNVLITGGTGFLGGATAVALMEAGHGHALSFLVRAKTAEQGLERLRGSLTRFEVPEARLAALTTAQIIPGDLADVSGFVGDARLDAVTHVVNCAAITSFGKHPLTWPVNVEGTFAFAKRMSTVKGLKRFIHVGTAMACGPNKDSKFVSESWNFPDSADHLVAYTASKAEAERRMKTELPTLPLVVARPSIVVGHSKLGCAPSSSIFWVFAMAIKLEKFMCDIDACIDVVPVDYCAEALMQMVLLPRLDHDLYQISAGRDGACSFREIDKAAARAYGVAPVGERYEQISVGDIKALAPSFALKLGIANRRLMMRAMSLYGAFSALDYVFDNSRLTLAGVAPPPRFVDYIGCCIKSTEGQSLMQQMLNDFK